MEAVTNVGMSEAETTYVNEVPVQVRFTKSKGRLNMTDGNYTYQIRSSTDGYCMMNAILNLVRP